MGALREIARLQWWQIVAIWLMAVVAVAAVAYIAIIYMLLTTGQHELLKEILCGTPWTAAELHYLRKTYPREGRVAVAAALGRSKLSVKGMIDRLGLKANNDGRWKQGHTPHNVKEGQYIMVRYARRDDRYSVWLQVQRGHWVHAPRYVWRQVHGPIPQGMVVALKNGNPFDVALENMELVSRAEMARRNNGWRNYPPELMKAKIAVGRLQGAVRKLSKINKIK